MSDSIEKSGISSGILSPKKSNAAGHKGLILLIVGIIVLIVVVVFLVLMVFPSSKEASWHAVFLTNGQMYFGNIVKQNSNLVVLRNVYYLQVKQPAPAEEGKEQPQPQVSLVGISDEIHSPESEMEITRAHILFVEKLKKDSQIVTTIGQLLNR